MLTYTSAHHRVEIKMFWLRFCVAPMTFTFEYNRGYKAILLLFLFTPKKSNQVVF